MIIYEWNFQIWKDGKYTGRDVGILFSEESIKNNKVTAKLQRLYDDYPESDGYFLKDQGRVLYS